MPNAVRLGREAPLFRSFDRPSRLATFTQSALSPASVDDATQGHPHISSSGPYSHAGATKLTFRQLPKEPTWITHPNSTQKGTAMGEVKQNLENETYIP